MKKAFAFFILFASFQAFSVPTSTPDFAERVMITASAARTPSWNPPAKSNSPGVSITLTLTPSCSNGATAEETEILRLISSGSKSQTVLPSAMVPRRSVAPAI